jgi:hypothetical protein
MHLGHQILAEFSRSGGWATGRGPPRSAVGKMTESFILMQLPIVVADITTVIVLRNFSGSWLFELPPRIQPM